MGLTSARPRFYSRVSGDYYGPEASTIGTLALTNNNFYAIPFRCDQPTSFSSIGIEVTVAGTITTSLLRLGVYLPGTAKVLGDVLLDAGTYVSDGTTGFKEITTSFVLPAGIVWLVLAAQGGPAASPTVRSVSSPYPSVSGATTTGSFNAVRAAQSSGDGVTGAFPANPSSALGSSAAFILLKAT